MATKALIYQCWTWICSVHESTTESSQQYYVKCVIANGYIKYNCVIVLVNDDTVSSNYRCLNVEKSMRREYFLRLELM